MRSRQTPSPCQETSVVLDEVHLAQPSPRMPRSVRPCRVHILEGTLSIREYRTCQLSRASASSRALAPHRPETGTRPAAYCMPPRPRGRVLGGESSRPQARHAEASDSVTAPRDVGVVRLQSHGDPLEGLGDLGENIFECFVGDHICRASSYSCTR